MDEDKTTPEYQPPSPDDPIVGRVLSNYRILKLLDAGGMGRVYEGEHIRLGRKAAIKVLNKELAAHEDGVTRFFREARAVNDIGHPNIVDISDFVEKRDEEPPLVYMVMERLYGQDLHNRIHSVGTLEPEEAVWIARQVTDALITVHQHRILHRDLKPENIFLAARDQEPPTVKLLDFGLAKVLGDQGRRGISEPGGVVGTPAYMAPEQVLGYDLDDRTDIYAVGVVLYHMLAGSVPFETSKVGEQLIRQVKEPPPPIAEKREKGGVPSGLEEVVMRCLAKKPANRFQSAQQLREALDSCLQRGWMPSIMIRRSPGSSQPDTQRQSRRGVIIGLLLVLGIAGGALLGWLGGLGKKDSPVVEVSAPRGVVDPDAEVVDATAVVLSRPDAGAVTVTDQAVQVTRRRTAAVRPRLGPRKSSRHDQRQQKGVKRHKQGKKPGGIHGMIDPFAKE